MPDDIFYWFLNMSIIGTLAGCVVMLLRLIKRIPRRMLIFLWIAPFLRFILPFGINSSFSIMAILPHRSFELVELTDEGSGVSAANLVKMAESYDPIVYLREYRTFETVFGIAFIVWLIVAAALLLYFAMIYYTTMRELKDSEKLRDNVYVSGSISSPALYGIIRPRIIMPSLFTDKDLTYIILHEKTHIKRKDNLKRVIAILVTCLHWFNPFAWIFLRSYLKDIELACDESAIKDLDNEKRKRYAHTLLDCAGSKSVFASAFGGTAVRVRIENILSYKKLTIAGAVAFAILAAAVIYTLITNSAVSLYNLT